MANKLFYRVENNKGYFYDAPEGGNRITSIIYNGTTYTGDDLDLSLLSQIAWDNTKEFKAALDDDEYTMSGSVIERFLKEKLSSILTGVKIDGQGNQATISDGVVDISGIVSSSLMPGGIDSLDSWGTTAAGSARTKPVSAYDFWSDTIESVEFVTSIPADSEKLNKWLEAGEDTEELQKTKIAYGQIALKIRTKDTRVYYTEAHSITGIANKIVVRPALTIAFSNTLNSTNNANYLNANSEIYLNYQCQSNIINDADNKHTDKTIVGAKLELVFKSNNILIGKQTITIVDENVHSIQLPYNLYNNLSVTGTLTTDWEETDTEDLKITASAQQTRSSQVISLSLLWVTNLREYGTPVGANWTSGNRPSILLQITGSQSAQGTVTTLYNLTKNSSRAITYNPINAPTSFQIWQEECVMNTINRFAVVSEINGIISNYLYIELPVGQVDTPELCLQYSDSGEPLDAFISGAYQPKLHVTQYAPVQFNYYILKPVSNQLEVRFTSMNGSIEIDEDSIISIGNTGTVSNTITYSSPISNIKMDQYDREVALNITEMTGLVQYQDRPAYEYNAKYKSNDQSDRNVWANKYDIVNNATITGAAFTGAGSGWYPADVASGTPAYLLLSNGSTLTIPSIFGNNSSNGDSTGRTIEMLVMFDNCLTTLADCITATNRNNIQVCAISPDRVKFGYSFVTEGVETTDLYVAAPITYGRWVHITMVIEGTRNTEYTNGNTVFYSKSMQNSPYTPVARYFNLYVDGVRSSIKQEVQDGFSNLCDLVFSSNTANVKVAFLRAWNTPLSSDQVLALKNTAMGTSTEISHKVSANDLLEKNTAPNISFSNYVGQHNTILIDGDMQAFNNTISKKDAIIAKYFALIPGTNAVTTKEMGKSNPDYFEKIIISLYPELQTQGTSSRVYPIHNIRWYMKHKAQGKKSSAPGTTSQGYTDNALDWFPVDKKSKNIYKYPTGCVLNPDAVNYSNGVLYFSYNNITARTLGLSEEADTIWFYVNNTDYKLGDSKYHLTTDISFDYNGVTYHCIVSRAFLCEEVNCAKISGKVEYKKGPKFRGFTDNENGSYSLTADITTEVAIPDSDETETRTETKLFMAISGDDKILDLSKTITFDSGVKLTNTGKSSVFCLKADFVDSSQTHNTGSCSAINEMYDENPRFAPPSHANELKAKGEYYQSGIEGLPVDIFWINTNDQTPGYNRHNVDGDTYWYWRRGLYKRYHTDNTPNYAGKYMLNLDKKSSGALFGLESFNADINSVNDFYDSTTPNLCVEVGTNRLFWSNWIPMYCENKKGDKNPTKDYTYPGDYILHTDGWTADLVKEYFDSPLINNHNDESKPDEPKQSSGDGDSSSEFTWEVRNYNVPKPNGGFDDYADGDTLTDILDASSSQGNDIAQQWAELCQYIWTCFSGTPGYIYWDSRLLNLNNAVCNFTGWKTDKASWDAVINLNYWTKQGDRTYYHGSGEDRLEIQWNQSGFYQYVGGVYDKEIYWPRTTDELKGYSGESKNAYELQAFKETVGKHFNVRNICLWYLYTEIFLALDQRTKNCTFATWDVQLRDSVADAEAALDANNLKDKDSGIRYAHWNLIPYDSDTVLGVNNNGKSLNDKGEFTIPHTTNERTPDADNLPNFAGFNNCLWKLVRDNLYGTYGGAQEESLCGAARVILTNAAKAKWKSKYNSIADNWPDIIYNKDQELKYYLPNTEYSYSTTGDNPFDNYIDNIQGTAYLFRNGLIDKCYSYLYGKYGSEDSDMCGFGGYKNPHSFALQSLLSSNCWVNGVLCKEGTRSALVNFLGDNSSMDTAQFYGLENAQKLFVTPNSSGLFALPSGVNIVKGSSYDDNVLSKLDEIVIDTTSAQSGSSNNFFNFEGNGTQNPVKLIGLKKFQIKGRSNRFSWQYIYLNTATYLEEIDIDSTNTLMSITPLQSSALTKLKMPAPSEGIELNSCSSLVYNSSNSSNVLFSTRFGANAKITINNCPNIDIDLFITNFCNQSSFPTNITIGGYRGDGKVLLDLINRIGSGLTLSGNIELTSFKYLQQYDAYTHTAENSPLYEYLLGLGSRINLILPEYTAIKLTERVSNVIGGVTTLGGPLAEMYSITNMDNSTGYGEADDYELNGHIGLILNKRHRYVGTYNKGTQTEYIQPLSDTDGTMFADGTSAANYINGGNSGGDPYYDVWIKEPHYWYKGINDYEKGVRYIAFSSNTNEPSSPEGQLYRLEDFTAEPGDVMLLEGKRIDASNTTDANIVITSDDSFNALKIDVSEYKYVQFPIYSSNSATCCVTNAEGKTIYKIPFVMITSSGSSTGYVNYSPFLLRLPQGSQHLYLSVPSTRLGEEENVALWRYVWLTNSDNPIDWEPLWVEHKECLVGAYESCLVNDWLTKDLVFASISGKDPAGGITYGRMQILSHARGEDFHAVSYEQSKDICNLFFAKYGTKNSSYQCGTGTDSSYKKTGLTNDLGMFDTMGHQPGCDPNSTWNNNSNWYCSYKDDKVTDDNHKNARVYTQEGTLVKTYSSVNCMGYDNFQGNKLEVMGNSWLNLETVDNTFTFTDPVGGLHLTSDTPSSENLAAVKSKIVRKLYNNVSPSSSVNLSLVYGGRYADTIGVYSANSNYGECYGDYINLRQTTNRCCARSINGGGAGGGVAYLDSYFGSSFSSGNFGSRLAFSGKIVEVDRVENYVGA